MTAACPMVGRGPATVGPCRFPSSFPSRSRRSPWPRPPLPPHPRPWFASTRARSRPWIATPGRSASATAARNHPDPGDAQHPLRADRRLLRPASGTAQRRSDRPPLERHMGGRGSRAVRRGRGPRRRSLWPRLGQRRLEVLGGTRAASAGRSPVAGAASKAIEPSRPPRPLGALSGLPATAPSLDPSTSQSDDETASDADRDVRRRLVVSERSLHPGADARDDDHQDDDADCRPDPFLRRSHVLGALPDHG